MNDSRIAVGDRIELQPTHLAYGGDAVARAGDLVVFVPFAAPGDRVSAEIVSVKRNHARARIVALLEAGPTRVTPKCRYFGTCGGCQLQHVATDAQREAKSAFVGDALRRIGGIDWQTPIEVHGGDDYAYRARARVHRERGRMGFRAATSNEVVDIANCPILEPELDAALGRLRTALADRRTGATEYALTLGGGRAACRPAVPGFAEVATVEVGKFRYEVNADGFFQANPALLEALVAAAIGDRRGASAFDLYCGGGLFTLPLAERFTDVLGIESDSDSVGNARRAALEAGVTPTFVVADVVEWLRTRLAKIVESERRPEFVLLDPPRTGVGAGIVHLAKLAAPEVCYVSCDPPTLARDLRVLCDNGYAVRSVTAFDLFPQTTHVECVVQLART